MVSAAPDSQVLEEAAQVRKRFARRVHKNPWCLVQIATQTLHLMEDDTVLCAWPVSTSRFGVGCHEESYCTPTGAHRIAECIGADAPLYTIFRHRVATHQRYDPEIGDMRSPDDLDEDIITSRILWLSGLEEGINAGGTCDSQARFIYIHGTTAEDTIGSPDSIGCVRMRNADVIALFDKVKKRTFVLIVP